MRGTRRPDTPEHQDASLLATASRIVEGWSRSPTYPYCMNRRQRAREKAKRLERARVRQARQAERERRKREFHARVAEGERRGCLVCRGSDGGFTSAEHAFPESLGNTEIVLQNGVVCDRCNNGVLSDLDQTLTEFWPLKLRRTMLGISSKAGEVPVSSFRTGSLKNTGEANLMIELAHPKDTKTFRTTDLGGGRVKLDLSLTGGRRMTPRYAATLSRAFLKVSLECAWLDHGEEMLGGEFDHVRDAILGAPRDGYLAIARKADPDHTSVELTYWLLAAEDGRRYFAVSAKLFGVYVLTESLKPRPPGESPGDEVCLITFTESDAPRRRVAA